MKTEAGARRGRGWLWTIVSLLFVVGIAVSTAMAHSERNRALDRVAEVTRDEAQSVTAILTGNQFTKPVTGSSYDKLSAKVRRFVSSNGSIVGVTVWSSRGKVLFSRDESRVGDAPTEMRSLIEGIARGSGSTHVLDDTVQTFTPVSRSIDGPVAVVQIDQPIAVVDAQAGDLWSTLRLGSTLGLAVSLLLLGLTFVSSRTLVRAPSDEGRPARDDRDEGEGDEEMTAVEQPEEPAADAPTPAPDEDLQPLQADVEQTVDEDVAVVEGDPEHDLESPGLKSGVWTQWRDELQAAAIENGFDSAQSMQESREETQDLALEGDLETELEAEVEAQESMRQWREEFKARAKQAELRLKKPDAELEEASSAPSAEK